MNQSVILAGKVLCDGEGQVAGNIIQQLTQLGMCDQHEKCPGPIVRLQWSDGRLRRECLYSLIKQHGYKLAEKQ